MSATEDDMRADLEAAFNAQDGNEETGGPEKDSEESVRDTGEEEESEHSGS